MGLFEDLFDFNGNGKVDLNDDFLLLAITNHTKGKAPTTALGLHEPSTRKVKPIPPSVKVRESEWRKQLSDIIHEARSVPVIYTVEQLSEVETVKNRLLALLARAENLEPYPTDTKIHEEWREVFREIKTLIFSVEYADELLSGRRSPCLETVDLDLVALEEERSKMQENEPKNIKSIEWDRWYRRIKELEEKILDLE